MRALRKARAAASSGAALKLSRREMLAGGIGAGALIALPDLSLAGRAAGQSARSASSGGSGSRHVLLYGTPGAEPFPGGSVAAAVSPASRTRSSAAAKALPAARPVATQLTSAPVASADQASVALVTVDAAASGECWCRPRCR